MNRIQRLVVYSGVPADSSGTGRFVSYLQSVGAPVIAAVRYRQSPRSLLRRGRFIAAVLEEARFRCGMAAFHVRLWLARFQTESDVLLLHPQSIGMKRVVEFVRARRRATYLYILDSSFFCVRSYNFMSGARRPCLECVGGRFEAIRANECEVFPVRDEYAPTFVEEMRTLVSDGRLRLVAQCSSHARIAETHFSATVPVVGLWCGDWDSAFSPRKGKAGATGESWAVVFHGPWAEAKGGAWLLEVAKACPELTFLFPFALRAGMAAPENCTFRAMSWETGLEECVRTASLVAVPSIWSASIEGALVKSVAVARAVCVIENDTAYSSELPDGLLLRLPQVPSQAANLLRKAVGSRWMPDPELKRGWLETFQAFNRQCWKNVEESVVTWGRVPPPADRIDRVGTVP